jgi:hypothetical protein
MRHGRKNQHQRFDGYKLSAAATNTSEPLITAMEFSPACEQDGLQAMWAMTDDDQGGRPGA